MISVHLKRPFHESFSKTDFFIGDTILNELELERFVHNAIQRAKS